MKQRKHLLAVGTLVALSSIALLAAVVTDRSSFSGDETTITFNDLGYNDVVTTQYATSGVTISNAWGAAAPYEGAFPWPGSGAQTLANFAGGACPCETITVTFDSPVKIAGAEFVTEDTDDLVLEAYSGGVLVDGAVFSTGLTPTFAGLSVATGFDTLTIRSSGPSSNALLVDDLSFELAATTKASILGGSGVPGKGIVNAPGLQKEFNPKSKAADNAGKKGGL